MTEIEIWRDIVDHEGSYEVSNSGLIRSRVKNKDGCAIKTFIDKRGYVRVSLYQNKKQKTFSVHRIVAQSFIENPLNKPQVNHKNGIKHDNNVSNLEWATRKENMQHAHMIGLIIRTEKQNTHIIKICTGRFNGKNFNAKKVIHNNILYSSIKEAAAALVIPVSSVYKMLGGRRNKINIQYYNEK